MPPLGIDPAALIPYERARFRTQLPVGPLYTAGHFWIREVPGAGLSPFGPGQMGTVSLSTPHPRPGLWRIGFTRFAVRVLGELVEHAFEVKPGANVRLGQIVGWVEGFKTVTDLHAVVSGRFVDGNPELLKNLALLDQDPYGRGWLYEVEGEADPNAVDVQAYIRMLDESIDRMMGVRGSVNPGAAAGSSGPSSSTRCLD
jgi:glycine cleavage system H protein